ncbi:MAG TPA: acyl-ACP thioesterase domain-containing protein [Rectinemataceae bacterium]|nr:acyl-ACP thioesterase domain-containing protein [Rectinemataceae bacterium]
MVIVQPLSLEFEVRGFDCGYGGPLRLLSLANFFQETAGEHADQIGYGVGKLLAEGRTWMLSRIDLRIDDLPRAGERVRVMTQPAGTERLFALRDLAMTGSDGRSLARAVYAYLVVDLATRRLMRPDRLFGEAIPVGAAPHPLSGHLFDLPPAAATEVSFAQRAWARHIDHNGHVNNAWLLDWLADAAPEDQRPVAPMAMRVEFLAEALEGDELLAAWGRAEGGILSELRRGGEIIARAFLDHRPLLG